MNADLYIQALRSKPPASVHMARGFCSWCTQLAAQVGLAGRWIKRWIRLRLFWFCVYLRW